MPNTVIRAIREASRLSQEEFAAKIRDAGEALGEPNECTVRTVQRWEQGATSYPRRTMVRAVEYVTGQSVDTLGFDVVPTHGRLSDHTESTPVRVADDARNQPPTTEPLGTLTGIWESRCVYHSSSRDEKFTDLAHLVVVHSGNEITARSIDGSVTEDSSVLLKLELRGHVVTGTWEITTGADSYYLGAAFYGAMQLQIEASGNRMHGAWVGFGRDFDVNTGPWELILRDRHTTHAGAYAHLPE